MASTTPPVQTPTELLLVASYGGTLEGYRKTRAWIEGIDGVNTVVYIGHVNGRTTRHLIGVLTTEAMRESVDAELARIEALTLREPIIRPSEPCPA